MKFNDCLDRINDMEEWDMRFHILAESNGKKWPVPFTARMDEFYEAWKDNPLSCCKGLKSIPEKADFVHGLILVNLTSGSAMLVNEEDLKDITFQGLMRRLEQAVYG